MLVIHKNTKNPLVHYYPKADACYKDIPPETEEKLRKSLLQEQGYLCAYCMCQITDDNVCIDKNMHIEHWHPQRPHGIDPTTPQEIKDQRLSGIDYKNLLAVCHGNKGKKPKEQHCDTRKGNTPIKFNPANPSHHAQLHIHYSKITGEISSHDAEFITDLQTTLNLNIDKLTANRKQIYAAVSTKLSKIQGTASAADIGKILSHWKELDKNGKYQPFAGVAIYVLERRLKGLRK